MDEVGRGPLAGPVLAAAVILSEPLEGLADLKQLSAAERAAAPDLIREQGVVAVGRGLGGRDRAAQHPGRHLLAMRRAVGRLPCAGAGAGRRQSRAGARPAGALRVGGDATVPEISAASIVAKVARDRLMARLARRHPGYGWERNAGYGTAEHLAALARLGLTCHHRRGFAPCARLAAGGGGVRAAA